MSHLVGLNGCRKEAPEITEKLLGPPFQQQGDLGLGHRLRAGHGLRTPAALLWAGSIPSAWAPHPLLQVGRQ